MPSPKTPPWRRAFVRALTETGSVALSAERAGVDRTSAYYARRTDPAFAKAWAKALSKARERLNDAGRRVRLQPDQVIRSAKSGRSCIVRAGPGRWSARAEEFFLAQLSASANVTASAEAAGFSTVAIYNRRMKEPGFAERWQAALETGFARIEMQLVQTASSSLSGEAMPGDHPIPPMTAADAMNLLKLHRAQVVGGKPQRYGWRQTLPDIETVRAEVLRKVAAMGGGKVC